MLITILDLFYLKIFNRSNGEELGSYTLKYIEIAS